MNNENAFLNLREAKEALDSIGVRFFLSNGTFLGQKRDGDFIGHDSDIDLGVFIEDWSPEIIKSFQDNGFSIYKVYGSLDNKLEYTFEKRGIHVDIFFYYNDGNEMWHGIFNGDKEARYIYPMSDLHEANFLGLEVLVPDESFLEAEYGNWKTPVREWHWWYSPRNIRYES